MSAPKENGTVPGPKGKGDGKPKDDTIAKITGAVIASGIAFSLYKSFLGKKTGEKPVGFEHAKSEPFHEQINIEKPELQSQVEADAKNAMGDFKEKAGEFKGAVEDKARELKSDIKGEGQDVKKGTVDFVQQAGPDKNYFEEGKDYASSKGNKVKDTGSGWFKKAGSQVSKDKEEAQKLKDSAGKKLASDKEKIVETGSSFLDKVGAEANREKEIIKGVASDVERNIEKGGAAVAGKSSELAHKIIPGGKSKSEAWSKAGGSKGGKKEYGIVRGDTLWSISRRYGVTIEELKKINNIWDADYIVAGDTLTISK